VPAHLSTATSVRDANGARFTGRLDLVLDHATGSLDHTRYTAILEETQKAAGQRISMFRTDLPSRLAIKLDTVTNKNHWLGSFLLKRLDRPFVEQILQLATLDPMNQFDARECFGAFQNLAVADDADENFIGDLDTESLADCDGDCEREFQAAF
jgi:hypothetical protein